MSGSLLEIQWARCLFPMGRGNRSVGSDDAKPEIEVYDMVRGGVEVAEVGVRRARFSRCKGVVVVLFCSMVTVSKGGSVFWRLLASDAGR